MGVWKLEFSVNLNQIKIRLDLIESLTTVKNDYLNIFGTASVSELLTILFPINILQIR